METKIPDSAVKLTPLQLNAIKLDVRHTVLSPEYLENLISNPPAQNTNPS